MKSQHSEHALALTVGTSGYPRQEELQSGESWWKHTDSHTKHFTKINIS